MCRCRNERKHNPRDADQSAHPRKGTLARVNPRLLIAAFLTGLFALGAAAYAIVESSDEPPDEAFAGFAGSRLPDGLRAPDFELTDEQRLLEQSVREWGAREIAPHIKDADREHRFDRERVLGGMAKLGLENRSDIVRFALQRGWLKDA